MCKKRETPYSDNFDILVALVTYLALMDNLSRPPSALAKYLNLNSQQVEYALKHFKGLFRESIRPSRNAENEEKDYCLHIRYATRHEKEGGSGSVSPPAEAEYLTSILEFISKMVDIEKAGERQISSNWITFIAAVFALIASIIAIIVQ